MFESRFRIEMHRLEDIGKDVLELGVMLRGLRQVAQVVLNQNCDDPDEKCDYQVSDPAEYEVLHWVICQEPAAGY